MVKQAGIVALAVLALLSGGCSQQPAETESPVAQPSASGAPKLQPDESRPPEVRHIHALAMIPADQTLHAGTHYGLYRFPAANSAGQHVGEVVQDFMGFPLVGSDHFLGSDHPSARDSHRGAVMTSTDMRAWKRRAVLPAIDLAVSPHDRTDVLAFTTDRAAALSNSPMTIESEIAPVASASPVRQRS